MTRKIVALFLCLMITAPSAQAKMLRAGVRGGTRVCSPDVAFKNASTLGGAHLGGFARAQLFIFYFQPEVLLQVFPAQGNQYICPGLTVDMPLMVGISMFGFRLQVGPSFSWLLLATKEARKAQKAEKLFCTFGGQAGVGIDLWNIIIDLNVEVYTHSEGERSVEVSEARLSHPVVLSVGYDFL